MDKFDPEYNKNYVYDNLSLKAAFLQLAEEASELSQTCCKLVRIIDDENPTPVTYTEALDNFVEEYADVSLCIDVLGRDPEVNFRMEDNLENVKNKKLLRWVNRLSD